MPGEGFKRDYLGRREDILLDFFVKHAPVVSGRSKRYWSGSEAAFYQRYLTYCNQLSTIDLPNLSLVDHRHHQSTLFRNFQQNSSEGAYWIAVWNSI